jgi:hypothetical protein
LTLNALLFETRPVLASRYPATDLLVAAETRLAKPLPRDSRIFRFQYSGFQAARHNISHSEMLLIVVE